MRVKREKKKQSYYALPKLKSKGIYIHDMGNLVRVPSEKYITTDCMRG